MRNGADVRRSSGALTWTEMLRQVARDYPGLPDPRTLAVGEIVFFYNGLRDELKQYTKPKPTTPPPPRRPRKHG